MTVYHRISFIRGIDGRYTSVLLRHRKRRWDIWCGGCPWEASARTRIGVKRKFYNHLKDEGQMVI